MIEWAIKFLVNQTIERVYYVFANTEDEAKEFFNQVDFTPHVVEEIKEIKIISVTKE